MTSLGASDSFDLQNLAEGYRTGKWTPAAVAEEALRRIELYDKSVWTDLLTRDEVLAQVHDVMARCAQGVPLPLMGIPFGVKDNINVAGRPTTAACPQYTYRPSKTATAVQRLCDAGAIFIGKTNLDQFATGLVGTRSPYGIPANPFGAGYIPGGSSSGSAVAVSAGLVSFAIGTDTAGSGRVPAAFNNVVGLKPTRGRLSTTGVVPACRSLDCVSVFALTCDDAADILKIAAGYDPTDDFSRPDSEFKFMRSTVGSQFKFGVPADNKLKFFGNQDAQSLYHEAISRLQTLGGTAVPIDFTPFVDAGELLYDGPWVAERLAGLRDFVSHCPEAILPITRSILQSGRRFDAVGAFDGIHQLQAAKHRAAAEWAKMDFMLIPTAGTIYTIAEIEAEPLRLNANLGYYTSFANLLDLSAVAIPAGFQGNGMPFGVTLVGPAGLEPALLKIGQNFQQATRLPMGATGVPIPAKMDEERSARPSDDQIRLAVVGAHLSGQPLNPQLTDLGAHLVRKCRTAPVYRLYALAGTKPPKPGLFQTTDGNGAAIEIEIWAMSTEAFGRFVAAIPPPMGIGTLSLEDGGSVKGFICEPHVIAGSADITSFGGWLNFLKSR